MSTEIDIDRLGDELKRSFQETGLSQRDVARISGVSASTLSRIVHKAGMPDMETIVRVVNWLEQPVSRFVRGASAEASGTVVYIESEPLPNIVSEIIYRDADLSGDAKKALSDLFRVAYKAFHEGETNGQVSEKAASAQVRAA